MKLDVICPTYNRADLLATALDSFATAVEPFAGQVRLIVADNNSRDTTRATVEAFAARCPAPVLYVFEAKQGRHHALNAALAHADGDVVAFFDDDERLVPGWIAAIFEAMADPGTDFIGGPVLPDWSAPAPDWLPQGAYGGVLGIIDHGPKIRRYAPDDLPAMLTGGNCAIRKPMLDACGPYSNELMYAEDRYMWGQLVRHGARGFWIPALRVAHHVPLKRLNKRYFRLWASQEGRTLGKVDGAASGPGFPPWMLKAAATMVPRLFSPSPSRRFTAELELRKFAGYFIARNLPFLPEPYHDRA